MTKKIQPMTKGVIWKRITYFAFPIMLGNLFQQLYNAVDSLIVGNFLGSHALAAVSSCGSLIAMLIGFLSGIAVGAGVVIARFYGAKDTPNLKRSIHTAAAMGLIASVIITIFGVTFSPRILVMMGTPASVMPKSVIYLRIYFAGATGLVMYNTFMGMLQAVGDSRHPLYYLICSSLTNLVLDVIFITVFNRGVGGAAVATVISQTLSAGLCVILLVRTKDIYRIDIKKIRLDRKMGAQILRLGIPSGVQNSIISFANVVVQANINSFGAMAMAGYGACNKVQAFGFLPTTSFSLALTTFVGQNLGGREYERAKRGVKFGVITTMIMAECIGVLIFILAPYLISAFNSSPEVLRFGVEKARVTSLFYFLPAFSHALAGVLRGARKAIVPMLIMMCSWCFFRVAFLLIAVPLTHNIMTVYAVYPITWTLSSIAFLIYYNKANWLKS